jgi:hypothetical protein
LRKKEGFRVYGGDYLVVSPFGWVFVGLAYEGIGKDIVFRFI